ncbi:MAG: carbamoyltransferase [Gammaproteobacteria bacterium]|nr:carbamoyltransferase [Gammaproteobacteria bacterium]
MNILGISCYFHDASAALVQNGRVVAAAEEERFTRKKHDNRFPESSIDFCLRFAKLEIDDIDAICYYEKPLKKLERALVTAAKHQKAGYELIQTQVSQALHEQCFLPAILESKFDYTGRILYSDHHLSHAASAYYCSPFREAAILTVDGVGEWSTTLQATATETNITKLREIHYPHSLGMLYTTLTAFLGFKANNDEYKVMGLAPYGKPNYVTQIRELIKLHSDGSFSLDMRYFSFEHSKTQMYTFALESLLGPARNKDSVLEKRHMDIAASLQIVTEEILIALARNLREMTGQRNLCFAGGVALNSVANWKILKSSGFEQMWIQPGAGDNGAAIGAALVAHHNLDSSKTRTVEPFTPYLGPSYTRDQIKFELDKNAAIYTELCEDELCSRVADLLSKDRIIGWVQGRMEFGARALGNRSILANPAHPDMKEILNSRIKFREEFRPFAPAVLAEHAETYFQCNIESPYMLFVTPVRQGKDKVIPSVTHIDNTARLQTVSETDNPRFHKLISSFYQITDIPILINTSFNIRGEPIVCTPEDALNCFENTDIDYLVIENFLVEKEY